MRRVMGLRMRVVTVGAAVFFAVGSWAVGKHLILPQDTGPDSVDVSKYPSEQQANYKVFKSRCSQCHTLARPVNTTMTPDYWAHYVGIMVDKSPDRFEEGDAKRIYEFLVFDQQARKDKDPRPFYPPLTEEEIRALKVKQGLR